ncbi:MAG: polymer-forming cytoskeletal protein [Bacteroidales bacterium]|nr:polymer-forming cytoskeletal protein [Bacteroidales bacterium]
MAKLDNNQINEICRISKGTRIEGVVRTTSDIRVDGEVVGTVFTTGRLVLGETGHVSGQTLCTNLDVWGKLEGQVYVAEIASFKAACVFNGELHVGRLSVELGASYDGTCNMMQPEEFEKVTASYQQKTELAAEEVD